MAKLLQAGDKAPDFELKDQNGNDFRLSHILGKKNIVLYFYPKDKTRGCTAQACAFRDRHTQFSGLNAEIIGISTDSAASHGDFASEYDLPFRLLADDKNSVRKMYGVPKIFGLVTARVTFVIDKKGVIRHVHNSMLKPVSHINEALEIIEKIEREGVRQ